MQYVKSSSYAVQKSNYFMTIKSHLHAKLSTPAYLFISVMLVIFISEFVDMMMLEWIKNTLNISSAAVINLIDSSILVFLVYPCLHFLAFKPLTIQIEERTRMAEKIKKSENELDTVFNSISDMISMHDENFKIIRANDSFLKFAGITREELTSRKCYEIVHGTSKPYENCPHERCFESKKNEMLEIDDENASFPLSVNVAPVYDKDGTFLYSVHIARDITEFKQIERQLREKTLILQKMNDDLKLVVDQEVEKRRQSEQLLIQQSKVSAIGEMTAAIAQQLSLPINAIGITLKAMKEAHESGNFTDKYFLKSVETAGLHLKFISDTIVNFNSFFRPQKEKTLFNVTQSIDDTIALLFDPITSQNITIKITKKLSDTFEKTIQGYENEFKQVIFNIINNSRDAILEKRQRLGNSGGRGTIELKIGSENENIVVKISDDGGGIAEAIVDKIFEPYFTTKHDKGTGIGLYMCKAIIENNMNGKISTVNTDSGAVFIIKLPLVQ